MRCPAHQPTIARYESVTKAMQSMMGASYLFIDDGGRIVAD